MKRPLAILTGLAVAAGGVLLGTAPAHAAADTAWKQSVSGVTASWTGTSVKIRFDYDASVGDDAVDSATYTTSVNGNTVSTLPVEAYASGTKTVSTTVAGDGPATVVVRADLCVFDDDFITVECGGGDVFTATVLRVTAAPKGKASAVALLNGLAVTSEAHASSYKRARFGGWLDANRNGENTRAEVLRSESRITASVNRYGTVKGGRWLSAYDNTIITKASRMDVDHMVPLAEAWASGAWNWSARKRAAFANDLGYGPSLIAVSLSSNRSKGDRDPAEWVPSAKSDVCTYVKQFIAVKSRWHLSIDPAEKTALTRYLSDCSNRFIAKPGAPVLAALLPKAKPKPVVHKPVGGGTSSGTDPRYGTCTELRRHPNHAPYIRGVDPEYAWYRDRDGDGRVCE